MTMTKMINWRLATIRLWVLSIAFLGISLANVSCTSAEDEPSGQIREEGFFTSEVNALIDANYPEVVANGYAELIIPSTMFDPGIMKYADYFMLGLKGYIGTDAYEEPMLKALDYIESKTKVTLELAMSAMYLPVMKARLADKERTLETITAVWDELETASGRARKVLS